MKLHFAVRVDTHEVIGMEVSTNDMHDVRALPLLVEKAEGNVRVARALGDGAYDFSAVYGLLEGRGIEPVIKPRRNSRLDAEPPSRRRAVDQVRRLGYDG